MWFGGWDCSSFSNISSYFRIFFPTWPFDQLYDCPSYFFPNSMEKYLGVTSYLLLPSHLKKKYSILIFWIKKLNCEIIFSLVSLMKKNTTKQLYSSDGSVENNHFYTKSSYLLSSMYNRLWSEKKSSLKQFICPLYPEFLKSEHIILNQEGGTWGSGGALGDFISKILGLSQNSTKNVFFICFEKRHSHYIPI